MYGNVRYCISICRFCFIMNGLMVLGKLKAKHVIPMNLFTVTPIVAGAMRIVIFHGEGITPYFLCHVIPVVRIYLFMGWH